VRSLVWKDLDAADRRAALARPEQRSDPALQAAVRAIVEDVRMRGWDALAAQAVRLDGEAPRLVPVGPLAAEARRELAPEQVEAIELATRNVHAFHEGSMRWRRCRASSSERSGALSTVSASTYPAARRRSFRLC
jgi:histidinol dehydrogenase